MSEDIIRTNPPINAMDFGVPPLFAERAENYARWAVAAERERVMQIAQSMKADLEAKFEKAYMEGAMAGAVAEREACKQVSENDLLLDHDPVQTQTNIVAAIQARSKT